VSAGHAVPFVVLNGVQAISNRIGDETSFKRHGIEVGHGIPGPDRGKKNVACKGKVIPEGQDENRPVKGLCLVLQVKGENKNNREVVVTEVTKRHEMREPGDNPFLHPESGMDSKNGKIYLDQSLVDIGMEIMDQIPQRLIDKDDK